MRFDEVKIEPYEKLSVAELDAYIAHAESIEPDCKLVGLTIHFDGDYADLECTFEPKKFDRIRRITGYLVGTMDRWNNAKTSEERDRVKHDFEVK